MKDHKFFTLGELCASKTADKLHINNLPDNKNILEHLDELMDFLDPIRNTWGSAIKITSGYRCPKLNKQVGGSSTSAHQIGYAVDMVPAKGGIKKLFDFLSEYLEDKDFDQLIYEKSGNTTWVHFGLYNGQGKQRREIKKIIK